MPGASRSGWRPSRRWWRPSPMMPTGMRRELVALLEGGRGCGSKPDLRNEKINYKVREHSLKKVPLMLVVGKREAEERTVALRRLGGKAQEVLALDDVLHKLTGPRSDRPVRAVPDLRRQHRMIGGRRGRPASAAGGPQVHCRARGLKGRGPPQPQEAIHSQRTATGSADPRRAESEPRNRQPAGAPGRCRRKHGRGRHAGRRAQRGRRGPGSTWSRSPPTAEPPVCKILDYGKFKYEEQKKKNEARKKQKTIDVKEIKLRPNIDEHDYDVKMRKRQALPGGG